MRSGFNGLPPLGLLVFRLCWKSGDFSGGDELGETDDGEDGEGGEEGEEEVAGKEELR